jgi:hypothetical protein
MRGADLCDELGGLFECGSDSELARAIGVTPQRIWQIRNSPDEFGPKNLAKLVKRITETQTAEAFKEAVRPVVEFFPVEISKVRNNGRNLPFNPAGDGGKQLCERLRASYGLYAFYNSQAEIIYFGKAQGLCLFDEMVNAFNRDLPHYQIHRVRHPWGKYKSTKADELRRIKKENVTLAQTASYFSAYSISDQLIGGLEALFIRIAPNDIINVRIEASEMRAFPDPEI